MANNSDSPVYTSKLGQGAFSVPGVTELGKSKKQAVQGEVTRYVGNYLDSHAEEGKQTQREPTLKNRREHAKDVATNFYSLVTDFYEYGYGHSFHFAPIYDGKSLPECVAIYEQGVAKLLKAKPGMKLLVSPPTERKTLHPKDYCFLAAIQSLPTILIVFHVQTWENLQ